MMLSRLPQATPDSTGLPTAYDSVWAGTDVPTATPSFLESIMLSHDKLYVVLAVVLVIWFGIVFILFRTDRRIKALEDRIEKADAGGTGDAAGSAN